MPSVRAELGRSLDAEAAPPPLAEVSEGRLSKTLIQDGAQATCPGDLGASGPGGLHAVQP